MIHDAYIEVTCDECDTEIKIEPNFVYSDWSGKNGYYNTKDEALNELIEKEGWQVDGEAHYCEGCQES